MGGPEPLEMLFEAGVSESEGEEVVALPGALAAFYGTLRLVVGGREQEGPGAGERGRPRVMANLIETLDGVVALGDDEADSGGGISGGSAQDRAVMGLLRAVADAVIVGAATLRAVPRHRWTAEHIYPPFAAAYGELRRALGKAGPPLAVIVSGSGELDLTLPVFAAGEAPALIVTTAAGAERLRRRGVPAGVRVAVGTGIPALKAPGQGGAEAEGAGRVSAAGVLAAVREALGRGAGGAGVGGRAVATAADGGEPPQHPPARMGENRGTGRTGETAGAGHGGAAAVKPRAQGAGVSGRVVLVEGGPHLLADFYAAGLVDEQFLTLAPRVAGRDVGTRRLALVEGAAFPVDRLVAGKLLSVRRGGDLLFLRYEFGGRRG